MFGAPSSSGQITAIRNVSQLDSSLGQGSQMIFTNNIIFSINAPFDRTTWKNLQSPIQTVAMQDYGAVSQQGTIPINGDIHYRSINGVQSLILAVRSFGEPGNTPISTEMDRILKHDTERLLRYESAVNFDNRQLRTCSPVDTELGVYHRALAVMDFHLISSLSGKLPPVWEGIWTGLKILAITKGIVNGTERCYAMVLSDANEFQLWEITKEGRFDEEQSRIRWSVELPSYNFQTPTDLKRLFSGDLSLDKIAGQVDVGLFYRTDQELCWHDWDTLQFCAKYKDCADEDVECKDPHTYNELVQVKQKFRTPPDDFNDTMGKLNRVGQEFQPRIDFTGYCRLKIARFFAYPEQESQFTEKRSGE